MTHSWRVRVYWEDTDAGGVVYYANYLKFLERARTEWLRALGIDQGALRRREGVVMVIQHVELTYARPAHLDDELRVDSSLAGAGAASFTMEQRIVGCAGTGQGGTELVSGRVRAACLDAGRWRPRRFPPPLRAALAAMTGGD